MLAAGFALTLIAIAGVTYFRAIRSSQWWDDALALIILYTTIHIVGHIVAIAKMPIDNSLRAMLDDRNFTFVLMLVMTAGLVFIGEGFRRKRTFWRSLIAVSIVALFMFPWETAKAIAWTIDALVYFGGQLNIKTNPTFTVLWGAIGMALALQRLTFDEGTGGGGGKSGGDGGAKAGGEKKGGGGPFGGIKLGGK
jgi:uncharacterized membrane protein YgcG